MKSMISYLGCINYIETLSEKELWPGFTNSDEVCIACSNSPGAAGCELVGKKMTFEMYGF